MRYVLGVDLGTTSCDAALADGDGARIFQLGSRIASIPSVVVLREDGTVLTGEAADRRGFQEPARAAREFKRRLGDVTPILLGGTPYGAEALMAHLLRAIVADVATEQGGPPDTVVLSHPANYGPYKLDLMREVARQAGIGDVQLVSEPEAAAVHYAESRPLATGSVIAIYDLGGGTFDSAVVRWTGEGFELIGAPEGMERFGGIDLDVAVLGHVRAHLGTEIDDLDPEDSASLIILTRLREDCRIAKENLSQDSDTVVTVMLPSGPREIRVLRSEFEDMIRPRLTETLEALRRSVASAGVEPEALTDIVLVGGSSRIPLVGDLVRSDTGRPVAVDTQPEHAVALGAARYGHSSPAAGGTMLWADIQSAVREGDN